MLVMLFLFVEVADARAVVDARLAAHRAGLHQQVIDQRRLARRAVPANGNVANVLDVPGHDYSYQKLSMSRLLCAKLQQVFDCEQLTSLATCGSV